MTKKKEWGEIVREMNFPVSPSAGFTLKKQYVKFLFEVNSYIKVLKSYASQKDIKIHFGIHIRSDHAQRERIVG